MEASCNSTAPMYLLHKDGCNTTCGLQSFKHGRNTRKPFLIPNIVKIDYELSAQQQTNHHTSGNNIMKINKYIN